MITAVDSTVLLDILHDSTEFAERSYRALVDAQNAGALVACPVVWAEVAAFFPTLRATSKVFAAAGVAFDPFDAAVAERAGALWHAYRKHGGTRERLVPDFFVGAHALLRADRLVSRDRGFFRGYFEDLEVIDPSV